MGPPCSCHCALNGIEARIGDADLLIARDMGMLVRGGSEMFTDTRAVSAGTQHVPRPFVNVDGWAVTGVTEQ